MKVVGSLRSQDGSGVVHLEARFESDIADVWAALTDPERVGGWYGNVEGDLGGDGDFRVTVPVSGWKGTAHVEKCDPPKHLVVRTREDVESFESGQGVPPFDSVIDVTLESDGAGTSVVADISGKPLDKLEYFGAGWQMHAEDLGAYLAGTDRDGEERFDELVPFYQPLADELRKTS